MTKIEKSLKSISWLVTEDEYRADPAYSYSTIAKFDREGFEKLDTLFDKVESPSLLFGSCVDTLLTDGQKAFDERFMVADFPSITDTVRKIVEEAFNMFHTEYTTLSDIPVKKLGALVDTFDFYKNWKIETRVNKIVSEGSEYYNDLLEDGILYGENLEYAKQMLKAAALTYVAALASSILYLIRFLLIIARERD